MRTKPVYEVADAPTSAPAEPTPAPAAPSYPTAVPSGNRERAPAAVEAVAPPAPAPTALPTPTLTNDLLTPPPEPPKPATTVPEKYEVKIRDGILPPGVQLPLTEDLPFVQERMEWARKHGLSQEAFESYLSDVAQASIAHLPNARAEIDSLGEGGEDRVKRIVNWYRGKVSPEAYRALSQFGVRADYFRALEEVMELAGEPRFAPAGSTSPPTGLTRAKVETMMQDPRYWRDHDPHYIAEVEHAWKQVVGSGVHKSSAGQANFGRRRAE